MGWTVNRSLRIAHQSLLLPHCWHWQGTNSRAVGILHAPLQSPQWWHLHSQAAIPHQLANITVAGSKTGSPFEKIKGTNTLPHLRSCRPWFPSCRRWYSTKYTCKGRLFCVNTENYSFCTVPIQLHRPHSPSRNEPLLKTMGQAMKLLPMYSTIFLCKAQEFQYLKSSLKHLEIFLHSPMSRTLCLAVCCRECQYFQYFSCSSLFLSSLKTTMTTLYEKQHQSQIS